MQTPVEEVCPKAPYHPKFASPTFNLRGQRTGAPRFLVRLLQQVPATRVPPDDETRLGRLAICAGDQRCAERPVTTAYPLDGQSFHGPGTALHTLGHASNQALRLLWTLFTWIGVRRVARAACAFSPSFVGGTRFFFEVGEENRVVALTIDDAPARHSAWGHAVLDILKENEARATFFVISSYVNEDNAEVMRRCVEEGHEFGNHMVADEPAHRYEAEEFREKLLECETALHKFSKYSYGQGAKWFRPPCGVFTSSMLQELQRCDYHCVLGDVYNHDVALQDSTEFLIEYVERCSQPGSILIIHTPEPNYRENNLHVLATLLPRLRERGFKCVTLSEAHQLELKRQALSVPGSPVL